MIVANDPTVRVAPVIRGPLRKILRANQIAFEEPLPVNFAGGIGAGLICPLRKKSSFPADACSVT